MELRGEELDSHDAPVVLIANDDDALLIALRMSVKHMGVSVVTAVSVEQALSECEIRRIDLIISDIDFGKGNLSGYDFLRRMRSRNVTIPFYFLSGSSFEDEESKAKAMGATGYVQLPGDEAVIESLLARHCLLNSRGDRPS